MPTPQLFPSLAGLSAESQNLLASTVKRIACDGGVPLVARGDTVAGAYLVESGALRVYYISAEGREGTLYWVEPGETCVLALNAMFSGVSYPAWVESEGATRILIIPGDVYRRLFAADAAMQRFTFDTFSGRLFELMQLIEETASQGLETRVAAFLLRRSLGGNPVIITHDQIARHLATSREVVTRLLRSLSARGVVTTSQGSIGLTDLVALRNLAGAG